MADSQSPRAPFLVEGFDAGALPAQLAQTAEYIANQALQIAGAAACVVCGVDKPRGKINLLAVRGMEAVPGCSCTEPKDPSIQAALTGHVSNVGDLSSIPAELRCPAGRAKGYRSRLVVPLADGPGTVGVAQVYGSDAREFSNATVNMLVAQGRTGALALENARLYDRAGALFALANALSTTLELQAVGDSIAEQVARAMGAKGCTVRVLDRMTRRLDLIGSYGLSRKYLLDKGPVTAGAHLSEVLAGKPVAIRDVATDPRMQYPQAAIEEGIASMATVPMVVKGVVTGVLRVYTDQPYDFAAEDIAFLCAAAGVAGAAVENARLYDGIRQDFEVLVDEIVYMRRAARAVGGSKEART